MVPSKLELEIMTKLFLAYKREKKPIKWKCLEAFKELELPESSDLSTVNSSKYIKTVAENTHEHWILTEDGIRYMEELEDPEKETALKHILELDKDLKDGEGQYVEFKEYKLQDLELNTKQADEKKDDLGIEIAAISAKGGRIYIGIANNCSVTGVSGNLKAWNDILIKRCLGNIRPEVIPDIKMLSYEGKNIIKISLATGEPIYYYKHIPQIRDADDSRKALPDDVKAVFREYFEKIHQVENPTLKKKKEILQWMLDICITSLTTIRLYSENYDYHQKAMMLSLNSIRENINSNLSEVSKYYSAENKYYKLLDDISTQINTISGYTMTLGEESWQAYLEMMEKLEGLALSLLTILREENLINTDLKEDINKVLFQIKRWLHEFNRSRIVEFKEKASDYVNRILEIAYLLILKDKEVSASKFFELADQIARLSWGQTNEDAKDLIITIPKLITRIEDPEFYVI